MLLPTRSTYLRTPWTGCGKFVPRFSTPEDINDGANTAPSKRIKQEIPRYQKVQDGPLVAQTTGIDRMLAECPRFRSWITRLESLGE